MKKALAETKLQERFTEHDLRAVTGTAADESGMDAKELLGHSNQKTTEVYLRSKSPTRIRPLK
jgi:integrase